MSRLISALIYPYVLFNVLIYIAMFDSVHIKEDANGTHRINDTILILEKFQRSVFVPLNTNA